MNTIALDTLIIRHLGQQEYVPCWQAMRHWTQERDSTSPDECWFVEHFPVYTQGQSGKAEHILNPGAIPVVQTDRGGQVTYHGPGQLMIYILIDLKRKGFHIRELVSRLEQSVIDFLAAKGITAYAKKEAPGIYIDQKKIGSIGLRVRRGCTYHGIAFNVAMDLSPFLGINPCGFAQLRMTQLQDYCKDATLLGTQTQLIDYLVKNLGYTNAVQI